MRLTVHVTAIAIITLLVLPGCGKRSREEVSAAVATPPAAETAEAVRRVADAPALPLPLGAGATIVGDDILLEWTDGLKGDYNRDGVVDGRDLFPLTANFNGFTDYNRFQPAGDSLHNCADGNRDGELNGLDLFIVSTMFGAEITGYRIFESLNGGDFSELAGSPVARPELGEALCLPEAEFSAAGSAVATGLHRFSIAPISAEGEIAAEDGLIVSVLFNEEWELDGYGRDAIWPMSGRDLRNSFRSPYTGPHGSNYSETGLPEAWIPTYSAEAGGWTSYIFAGLGDDLCCLHYSPDEPVESAAMAYVFDVAGDGGDLTLPAYQNEQPDWEIVQWGVNGCVIFEDGTLGVLERRVFDLEGVTHASDVYRRFTLEGAILGEWETWEPENGEGAASATHGFVPTAGGRIFFPIFTSGPAPDYTPWWGKFVLTDRDGNEIRRFEEEYLHWPVPDATKSPGVTDQSGRIIISYNGLIVCLDPESLEVVWDYELYDPDDVSSGLSLSLSLDRDGRTFFAVDEGDDNFYGILDNDGNEVHRSWDSSSKKYQQFIPLDDGTAYLIYNSKVVSGGYLERIDLSDMSVIWSHYMEFGDRMIRSIDAMDYCYRATENGVLCISPEGDQVGVFSNGTGFGCIPYPGGRLAFNAGDVAVKIHPYLEEFVINREDMQ